MGQKHRSCTFTRLLPVTEAMGNKVRGSCLVALSCSDGDDPHEGTASAKRQQGLLLD